MPNFLHDRPAIISGGFGKGNFLLSYPHLETPASPQANTWLSHILDQVQNEPHTERPSVPAWELSDTPVLWDDPVLHSTRKSLETIISTGQGHFLLFWRNPWLLGWRRGIPGASINSLYALICEVTSLEPNDEALQMWTSCKADFLRYMEIFEKGVTGYLLAERLAMTMRRVEPHSVFPRGLKEQRNALFGPPPGAGGMYAKLLSTLEELTWIINKKRK
jgi:hypothetical protein